VRALAAAALALMAALPARAEFVRGSIKVDVRDATGKPREAEVTVRGGAGGGDAKVARAGEVYVADGLIDGDYTVAVAGAGEPQTVHVQGRQDRGVVFVVGGGGKKRESFALGPRDVGCDAADGAVVEAVVFARGGGLGAGRIDVKKHDGGNLVCSAIAAGGAATLRLVPGDYVISARLVGGGTALERYLIKRDRPAPALALRAR
jgi:hypothetical protein